MIIAGCAVLGYFLGSLPFSVWLVRWFRRSDVRAVGDRNPGAVNAWRAGGWRIGVAALFLDVAKGAAAPAIARAVVDLHGWALLPVALSPVLGHALSPWLRLRGGKGIAATFGVWSALTYWVVPTTFGLLLAAIMQAQSVAAWTVVFASAGTLVVLLALRSEPYLVIAFLANVGLLAWTHRKGLRTPPRFGFRPPRGR
jgi:glycerol-3-phosphate acyltransferase PlsY